MGKRFELENVAEWELLTLAATCLDRIDDARKHIAENGVVKTSVGGSPKTNPACSVERDNKILFCRILRELGIFNLEP